MNSDTFTPINESPWFSNLPAQRADLGKDSQKADYELDPALKQRDVCVQADGRESEGVEQYRRDANRSRHSIIV
jgi:hypothetical protein